MSKTFDQFRGLKQMWNSAYLALANAKDVIFWGFSFPHSDVLVKQMMRNAFATNEKLKSIGIIDLVPEKPAAILQDLLPDRDDIYISIYEVPTDGSKPEWLTTSDCESAP